MKISVGMLGADKVMKNLSGMSGKAKRNAGSITETYARKMANDAGSNAPVLTGALRNDVISSPRKIGPSTWEFGGTLPYAREQEFEHFTNKGFIRRSVWNNRQGYRDALRKGVVK